MATREQLIEDFADHKYATGEKFVRLINSMKLVQEPVESPAESGTSNSFIDSISQGADGKITATKKSVVLNYAQIQNKPTINGVTLMGDKTPAQLGLATANQVEVVSNKVDKLPSGYYYGKFNSVEDLPEATEKGYAYVASSDPTVFYTYLVSGAGAEWVDSGNKMVNTVDITTPKTTETELSKGEKYFASANINDRPADVVIETGVVRSLGYRVLSPNLSFAEQVEGVNNANMIFEIKDSFDLEGGSVTIPNGCTLKFNGGKLVNGSITFSYTLLDGNPLITTSIAGSIKNNQLNVLWLGAKAGDETFDNTPIFQKAIDWAEYNKPSTVYVPIGTFYIQDTVNMKAGVIFNGEARGNEKTIVKAASSMTDMFYSENSNGMRITNIQIDGNRSGTYYSHATGFNSESTTLAENGISFYDLWYNIFNNVNVYNCSGWAIKIRHDSWVTDINNIGCYQCGNGILIRGLINGLKIRNSEFNTLGGFGIVTKSGHNFGISQNTFEIMGKCAIALTNNVGCNILDNYIEYPSIKGINNFAYSPGQTSSDIDGEYHCTILLIGNAGAALDDNFENSNKKIPINSAFPCDINIAGNYVDRVTVDEHHKFVLASGLKRANIQNNTLVPNIEAVLGAFYYEAFTIFDNVSITNNGNTQPLQSVAEKLGGVPASASSIIQGRLWNIWSDIVPNKLLEHNLINYVSFYTTNKARYLVEQDYKINNYRAYKSSGVGYIQFTIPEDFKTALNGTSKILLLEWYEQDDETKVISFKRQTINLNLNVSDWYFNRDGTKSFTMPIISLLGAKRPKDASYHFYISSTYVNTFLRYFKLQVGNYVSTDFDGIEKYFVTKDLETPDDVSGYTACYSKNSNSLRCSSAARPTPDSTAKGYMVYDETLKKPVWWNGMAWTDSNGETVGLQVSDTSVLIGATANSTKNISVYYGGTTAPTITVLNADDTANTWLTAAYTLYAPTFVANTYYSAANTQVTTKPSNWETNYMDYFTDVEATIPVVGVPKNKVVLTAGANVVAPTWAANTYFSESGGNYTLLTSEPNNWKTNYADYYTEDDGVHSAVVGVANNKPRGAKVLVTLGDELVIINVVQSY